MKTINIGDALFTKTQQRVLGLLYGKPDESFYTNQIVRLANVGSGAVSRELECLVAAGVLVVTKTGNQLHYRANQACPIYAELLNITKKTFGVVDVLREALLPLDKQIDFAFIYGSIAKGDAVSSSDIDLFVLSDAVAYADLMAVLMNAESSLGRKINPSIYSGEQVGVRLEKENAFVSRVLEQPKIWVKGSEDDFRKFVENSPTQAGAI